MSVFEILQELKRVLRL